jgi:SAM-dependent methyltransferase
MPLPKTCPICASRHIRAGMVLRDRFFRVTDEEFTLFKCGHCGLLFQDQEQVRHRLGSFYPPGYWWRPGSRFSPLEEKYRSWMVSHDQLGFVLSLSNRGEKFRCLDIGCGDGIFVGLALKAGLDAYGVDQSQAAAELASQRAPGRIYCSSEQDLVEKAERFQLITLFHTLEHMVDPFRYLKNLQRLLTRPGGLVIQVPNGGSLQARLFGRRWYGFDCPRHVYNYSLDSLLYLLSSAGYRIQRIRHFSLRDNAAAFVSSLVPSLDPMSAKVRSLRSTGRRHSFTDPFLQSVYFGLMLAAQPVALLESAVGRGGTLTVYVTVE